VATSCQAVSAAEPITLIRTYDSDLRGLVYEVCRGKFDPPTTDPANPAYCQGKPEYWSQQRWQAYVKSEQEPTKSEHESSKPEPTNSKDKPKVASGPSPPTAPGMQPVVPYGGSLDPTTILGVTNPLCGERDQLSIQQVRNCRSSRSPEAAYSVGNYGWDIHIEEGGFISSLLAPAVAFVLQIFSVFWLILLLGLKGCLIVLGFTFSLSPFTNNHMLRQIGMGLTNFYNGLTEPLLTALMVIIGCWALYNGMIRRRPGETVGGVLTAVVMMLGSMWMIHAPRETVGQVAEIVNETSLAAISAPTSGHLSAPVRSYNDAMASVWNQITEVPFCALDFSNVHWCLDAKPSKEAIEAAKGGLSLDEPLTQALLVNLPEDEQAATRVLNHRMDALFGSASTIRDLYLRFSPDSGPREALWTYYNGKGDNHVGLPFHIGPQIDVGGGTTGAAPDKVSMQGRSGLLPRMVLVFVFFLGLLGGLLLLLWIAVKLVMAAASTFVLVLMAPLALFFPAFGAAGRAAFVRWGTSLLGAMLAKLIFSALLGVVLLGSKVLGAGVGGTSPTLGLIATMSFWWAVFLNREHYLALLQIDPVRDHGTSFYRTMAGGYVGYRIAKAAKNAIGSNRAARQEQSAQRQEDQARAGREGAELELTNQARQRLDTATTKAQGRESSYSKTERDAEALRRDPDVQAYRHNPEGLDPAAALRGERKSQQLGALEGSLESGRRGAAADRQLLRRAQANEAAGLPRHSRGEIEAAKEAIRREAGLGSDAPEHRWRAEAVGKDPDSAAGRQAIDESLAKTRAAAGATSSSRLDQVQLHRRVTGGRRRSSLGLGDSPDAPGGRAPRVKRRSRGRDGLSR
jgi:hypothetical protein